MKSRVRRIVHRLFFMIVALATVVVLFYAVEDWRGARAWAAAKRDLQARGETLDFRAFVPPPVPDDQNLAMAPLFTRLFQYEVDPRTGVLTFNRGAGWYKSDTYKQFEGMPFGREKPDQHRPAFHRNWMSGHPLDLEIAQRYYQQHPEFPHVAQSQSPADDVLLALTHYGPLLDELGRASAERPQTRFPMNWLLRPSWEISLPHYNDIQLLVTTLRLRAVAELAVGQTPAARRDLMQMFRLRQAVENDPILIAPLVDSTCLSVLIQPIWERLAARQWSTEDLDALRDRLREINVLREYQRGIRGERAVLAARWPEDLQDRDRARELAKLLPRMTGEENGSPSSFLERWLWRTLPYWPRGWYEQNAALASRIFQEDWLDAVDPAGHRVALARNKGAERVLNDLPLTPSTLLVKIPLPAFSNIVRTFARTQTYIDQAVTACALEKYYLDHQSYPTALAVLVPGYLDRVPDDVIDGAPMRYRLTADGRYQLYSIGWDGQDGGGTIAWPPDRQWRRGSPAGKGSPFPNLDKDQGDWVWQYAPAEPPDPPANQSRLDDMP